MGLKILFVEGMIKNSRKDRREDRRKVWIGKFIRENFTGILRINYTRLLQ